MNLEELARMGAELNLQLIRRGLTDAEISFIGMCLMSYGISSTTAEILSKKKETARAGLN